MSLIRFASFPLIDEDNVKFGKKDEVRVYSVSAEKIMKRQQKKEERKRKHNKYKNGC